MSAFLNLRAELRKKANPKKAKLLQRYFKTGKGEYGEGDVFLGLSSLIMRPIAKKYKSLKLKEIQKLLKSKIHEERQTALLVLVEQFEYAMLEHSRCQSVVINHNTNSSHYKCMTRHTAKQGVVLKHNNQARKVFEFYLKNTKYINNWDLVDLSAPKIVGEYLLDKNRQILYKLAKSKNMWERRIAILATFAFIRENQFNDSLKIAEMLLNDSHELIHKAVGWMLREVGKRDMEIETRFLNKYASKMPRTMLRYAIEKLPAQKKKHFLYYGKIKS